MSLIHQQELKFVEVAIVLNFELATSGASSKLVDVVECSRVHCSGIDIVVKTIHPCMSSNQ